MMEYKTSLDTLAKIITIGVVILFIFIGQQSVKSLLKKGKKIILTPDDVGLIGKINTYLTKSMIN